MVKYVSKEPEITMSGKSAMSGKENVRKGQVEIGVGVIF